MYWIKLIKDIILWRKFAKIAKASRESLWKHNLRVDKLGRIYTVINLPEEISKGNEYMQEAWVLKNLAPYNKALEEIGLAGYAYPEMSRIKEPGTFAYLLVLYPDAPTISFRQFFKNVIIYGLSFLLIRTLYRVADDMFDLSQIVNKIIDYVI